MALPYLWRAFGLTLEAVRTEGLMVDALRLSALRLERHRAGSKAELFLRDSP